MHSSNFERDRQVEVVEIGVNMLEHCFVVELCPVGDVSGSRTRECVTWKGDICDIGLICRVHRGVKCEIELKL